MDHSWLVRVVEGLLFAGAMEATRRWFERSRRAQEASMATFVDGSVMAYPPFLLGLGVLCATMFGAFAMCSYDHPTGGPRVAAAFVAFALVGVYLIAETIRVRHTLRPDGISFRLLTREGELRWSDVTTVRYSPAMKTFRLDLAGGSVVRVSAGLTLLPAFARGLLAGAAPTAIDPATRVVLEQTAAGSPPSIWA